MNAYQLALSDYRPDQLTPSEADDLKSRLWAILQHRHGFMNAITSRELGERLDVDPRAIRKAAELLVMDGYPVGTSLRDREREVPPGFFRVQSREDLEIACANLMSRVAPITARVRRLRATFEARHGKPGQPRLEGT